MLCDTTTYNHLLRWRYTRLLLSFHYTLRIIFIFLGEIPTTIPTETFGSWQSCYSSIYMHGTGYREAVAGACPHDTGQTYTHHAGSCTLSWRVRTSACVYLRTRSSVMSSTQVGGISLKWKSLRKATSNAPHVRGILESHSSHLRRAVVTWNLSSAQANSIFRPRVKNKLLAYALAAGGRRCTIK